MIFLINFSYSITLGGAISRHLLNPEEERSHAVVYMLVWLEENNFSFSWYDLKWADGFAGVRITTGCAGERMSGCSI